MKKHHQSQLYLIIQPQYKPFCRPGSFVRPLQSRYFLGIREKFMIDKQQIHKIAHFNRTHLTILPSANASYFSNNLHNEMLKRIVGFSQVEQSTGSIHNQRRELLSQKPTQLLSERQLYPTTQHGRRRTAVARICYATFPRNCSAEILKCIFRQRVDRCFQQCGIWTYEEVHLVSPG